MPNDLHALFFLFALLGKKFQWEKKQLIFTREKIQKKIDRIRPAWTDDIHMVEFSSIFFPFFFYSLSLSFSFSFHSCFANTITNKLWPSHEFTCVSQCVWVYTFVWMCLCLYLMNEWMLYDSFNRSKDSDSLFLDIRPVRIKSHAVSPRFSSSALKSQP